MNVVEQLELRLRSIESIYLHADHHEQYSVITKLKMLDHRLLKFEKDFPEIKSHIEQFSKLSPLLSSKLTGLKHLVEQSALIYNRQEFLVQQLSIMQAIQSGSQRINSQDFSHSELLKSSLERISIAALKLQSNVGSQTAQIDQMLEIYEQAVLYISRVIETWDIRLRHIAV